MAKLLSLHKDKISAYLKKSVMRIALSRSVLSERFLYVCILFPECLLLVAVTRYRADGPFCDPVKLVFVSFKVEKLNQNKEEKKHK